MQCLLPLRLWADIKETSDISTEVVVNKIVDLTIQIIISSLTYCT